MTTAAFYTVTRPSRSGGHQHVIHLDTLSHTPIDIEHPCSCAAGSEGRWCWAALSVLVAEAPGTQSAEIAAAILKARAAKSVTKARH